MAEKRLTNVTYPHGCCIVSTPHAAIAGEPEGASDGWDHVLVRDGKCLGEFISYGEAINVARKANTPPPQPEQDETPAFLTNDAS